VVETNTDVYAKIAEGLKRLDRRLHGDKHDKMASATAGLWKKVQKQRRSCGLADFARLFDDTVPEEFDDYWDHPTYQTTLYLLFRAGAQPALASKPLRMDARKKRKARS
jgi:hypothetical protein